MDCHRTLKEVTATRALISLSERRWTPLVSLSPTQKLVAWCHWLGAVTHPVSAIQTSSKGQWKPPHASTASRCCNVFTMILCDTRSRRSILLDKQVQRRSPFGIVVFCVVLYWCFIPAGFGRFQWVVLFYCGCAWAADAVEMMLLSFLGPAVRTTHLKSRAKSTI